MQRDRKCSLQWLECSHCGNHVQGTLGKMELSINIPARDVNVLMIQDDFLDRGAIISFLKDYGRIRKLDKGSRIHTELIGAGYDYEMDHGIGAGLISMYAKCGALAEAEDVFDELPVKNLTCWNSFIGGYVHHGLGSKALSCFEQMHNENIYPNSVTYVCILKACGAMGSIQKGEEIHVEIQKQGLLLNNVFLGTALVDMYCKCGALAKAQAVFNELPVRNHVSWNALIAGYSQHELSYEALDCFRKMHNEGISPDEVTYASVLRACGNIGLLEDGEEIHGEIRKQGLLENNIIIGTALVDMYAKCGAIVKARAVFDQLQIRNAICWNALIAGYLQQGLGNDAVNGFRQMQDEGLPPTAVTFASMLKVCVCIGSIQMGEEIHAQLAKHGLLRNNTMLGNTLIDMYAKLGTLAKAQNVFDELSVRDVVSWNVLIAGYAQHGLGYKALDCFGRMQHDGFAPDAVTFSSILKVCGSIGSIEKGVQVHLEVKRRGLLSHDIVLGTTLIDMYAKCGHLMKAQNLFNGLSIQNIITWNTLINGYTEHGLVIEALQCFQKMQNAGIRPDLTTFTSILKACGTIGSVENGEEVHSEVVKQGLIAMLGTALVDMYSKCGALAKAQEVFDGLAVRDVASWTSLISGYSQLGLIKMVFMSFNKMVADNIVPSAFTFLPVLNACSHAGLVEEAQLFFATMNDIYSLTPTLEHYTSMVDVFSRAGHFDRALVLIRKAAFYDCRPLWLALLNGSRKWVNVEIGRLAFEHLINLDENYAPTYVCMCNIYVAAGMQEEADKVEALRLRNGSWKVP